MGARIVQVAVVPAGFVLGVAGAALLGQPEGTTLRLSEPQRITVGANLSGPGTARVTIAACLLLGEGPTDPQSCHDVQRSLRDESLTLDVLDPSGCAGEVLSWAGCGEHTMPELQVHGQFRVVCDGVVTPHEGDPPACLAALVDPVYQQLATRVAERFATSGGPTP